MTLDDKYTYPGSGGVLVNRLGIRDLGRLDQALNDYASVAWVQLRQLPPPEPPGFDYLRTIHREMFGSLLHWAGELRETDVQATGTGIAYARPEYISDSLHSLFRKLERENFLSGLDSSAFTDRLADRWGELSAIHPFRDGNTRSQSAYISAIAERTGHPIDWTSIDVPTLRNLRLVAVAGRHEPLAGYLRDHLVSSTDAYLDRGWSAARLAGLDTPFEPGSGRSTAAGLDSFGTTTYRADPGLGRSGVGRW
ncbi:MAG: Fic family protein [Microbacteriaceae bacterium]|nr:Fic family protein [Microbacteriaceae bacterium]